MAPRVEAVSMVGAGRHVPGSRHCRDRFRPALRYSNSRGRRRTPSAVVFYNGQTSARPHCLFPAFDPARTRRMSPLFRRAPQRLS
jgi:hypothetical protein